MPAPQSELAIVGLFRSRARIQCPGVKLVAIPNAAKRGQKAMNQARREGAQWGFPDMLCLAPGKVAFLEFKRIDGKVSDNQALWIECLRGMGFPATVVRDPDDGLAFLREHGFPFLTDVAFAAWATTVSGKHPKSGWPG